MNEKIIIYINKQIKRIEASIEFNRTRIGDDIPVSDETQTPKYIIDKYLLQIEAYKEFLAKKTNET